MTAVAQLPRAEYRCRGCGYGAISTRLPELCPICGGVAWAPVSSGRRTELSVTPLGGASALITVLGPLDANDLSALSSTVAALAHDSPEIVLDLTNVSDLPRPGARFLLRLGALARGAGGHLLARCRAGGGRPKLVAVDVDHTPALERADGAVGRAFRALAEQESVWR